MNFNFSMISIITSSVTIYKISLYFNSVACTSANYLAHRLPIYCEKSSNKYDSQIWSDRFNVSWRFAMNVRLYHLSHFQVNR